MRALSHHCVSYFVRVDNGVKLVASKWQLTALSILCLPVLGYLCHSVVLIVHGFTIRGVDLLAVGCIDVETLMNLGSYCSIHAFLLCLSSGRPCICLGHLIDLRN